MFVACLEDLLKFFGVGYGAPFLPGVHVAMPLYVVVFVDGDVDRGNARFVIWLNGIL